MNEQREMDREMSLAMAAHRRTAEREAVEERVHYRGSTPGVVVRGARWRLWVLRVLMRLGVV